MPDPQQSSQRARKFWESLKARDLDAVLATLAPDVVRVGPRAGVDDDTIRGKPAYERYLGSILSTMPAYDNITNDVVASSDGRRAYLHYTEIVGREAGSRETTQVSGVIIFHFDDAGLITLLDIFWRQPEADIEWTQGSHLVEAAERLQA